MECLKEFLTPKSYNRLSFLVIICWIVVGTFLFGIFAEMETSEPTNFRCAVKSEVRDYIQGKCFEQYDNHYNKVLPFYGFVVLNFSLIGIVCLTYSILIKSTLDELDNILSLDVERQRNLTHSPRLVLAYCYQLFFRFVLGAIFIVLQTKALYSPSFPSTYSCQLPKPHEQSKGGNQFNHPSQASTAANISTTYECHNPRATKKTFWATTVCVVNGVFMVFILIEIICILWSAKFAENSTTDLSFYKSHILNKKEGPLFLHDYVEGMKERIKQDTEEVNPLLPSKPGETDESRKLEFDQIYTNLVINPERARYTFNQNERREVFAEYLKPEREHVRMKPKDMFAPLRDRTNQQPRNILIVGRPGIGKTLLCRKISRDWASVAENETSHEINISFEVVFHVDFRMFNSATAENLNLQQLLNRSRYSTGGLNIEMYKYIRLHPEKVLLIFDGLDEYNDRSNIVNENQYENNSTEVMPFFALYGKLASGDLLKGATILTTTRPTAVSSVAHLSFCRTVEILGFTSEQIKEYVGRFTSHDSDAEKQVWNHISSNINLLSLCYVPVNCFIVCAYLQDLHGSVVTSASLPTTLTDIYDGALRMFVLNHNPEFRNQAPTEREKFATGSFTPTVKQTLTNLGRIAFKATSESRLIFESTEVEGLEDSGLLHRMPDLQTGSLDHKPQFCFLHLTMQEFFAARHIVATKDNEQLTLFVSEHIGEDKWHLVIQFVAGLRRDQEIQTIFTNLLPVVARTREDPFWPNQEDAPSVLTLCKCLFEYNKLHVTPGVAEIIAEKINSSVVVMSKLRLTPADCTALVYVLLNIKGISRVDVSDNYTGPLGCVEICKLLRARHLTTLSVEYNAISDEGVKYLCDVLSIEDCKLTNLNLSRNSITAEGVKHLCDALSTENGKITYLNLSRNSIAAEGVKYLSHALSGEHCKLTNLDLSGNKIGDGRVKQLSGALSREGCKPTYLNLTGNFIANEGVKQLSRALSEKACKLTSLNLSRNSIADEGVKYLSHALSKLANLNLSHNLIADEGARYLSGALSREDCKLTNLNLRKNLITDEGVKQLSGVLCREGCNLTNLDLSGNEISYECKGFLSHALAKDDGKLRI